MQEKRIFPTSRTLVMDKRSKTIASLTKMTTKVKKKRKTATTKKRSSTQTKS